MLWTTKIERAVGHWKIFTSMERAQFKTDLQALLCSGKLTDDEVNKVRTAIYLEQGIFYASRLYVPFALFMMYRRGVFQEAVSFGELRHVGKIAIMMHMIDLGGYAAMRLLSMPIVDKYVEVNDAAMVSKRTVDDFLIQKNYFK